ncbi:uncharacterized protein G2W53_020981 [Senna tora]|uniref:Uncharacterized protein n=1 Tax=Senna tora TaxID=362788 RepID=A0A834TIH7_9FABA|nr:uncharacterized protein G2W53_020981 [Senna tora]
MEEDECEKEFFISNTGQRRLEEEDETLLLIWVWYALKNFG